MNYIGIDYGLGQSNVDKDTGIRFGVISQHTVGQAWYEDAEPDYGKPTCPKCGGEVIDAIAAPEEWQPLNSHSSEDYACNRCEVTLDSSDVFGDEPIGWNFKDDKYTLTDCLDADIFVLKSPYYTFAQFCSPCVPGAGNLDNPMVDGVKTYCLGPEWFEDNKAPYPVFSVIDGTRI